MKQAADFKIVLLHDDPVSGERGSAVLERLAAPLEAGSDKLNTDIWQFEALLQAEFRAGAASRIREANLIMISATGAAELPGPVKHWMESTLSRRADQEAAIVALLDGGPADQSELPPLGSYLQELAAKSGMVFFCNNGTGRPQIAAVNEPTAAPFRVEGEEDFAMPEAVAPRDSGGRGWGINE
jgi:hypothetical protein